MMTIAEIKKDAQLAAAMFDLNWEKLEDPKEAAILTEKLELSTKMLPELEALYTKLTMGQSLILPDAETALGEEEIEDMAWAVAEELHAAYQLATIKETYEQVTRIIQLSGSL